MKKITVILLILLLVCSCAKKEAPPDPTVEGTAPLSASAADNIKEYSFTFQCIKLFRAQDASDALQEGVTVVYNTDDLANYGKDCIDKEYSTLEYSDSQASFDELTKKYDGEYFKNNLLVICTLSAPSASYKYDVTRLTSDAVYIDELVPESADTVVEHWAVIVESERFVISDMDIYLNGENFTGTPATVTVGAGVTSLSVYLPDGWDYTKIEHNAEENEYGIRFCPEGGEGSLYLMYQPFLGLCGTGLETDKKTYAGYECSVYTWDGKPDWDIIDFPADHGAVGVYNENAAWLSDREKEVEEILNSIEIKGSTLTLEQAKGYAAAEYNDSYDDDIRSSYDLNDDTYVITFRKDGNDFSYRVHPTGKVKSEKYVKEY